MKLSFSTLGCPNWDLPTIAARASAYGFDGVELRISGDKHVDPAMDTEARRETRALFARYGLAIVTLGGYTRFDSGDRAQLDEACQQMQKNIDLAVDLGAPYVRTFIGKDLPEGDIGIRADYLHTCGEAAREKGITILVETHDANRAGKRTLEIIQAADSPGVGALWDIQHTVAAGETPAQTYAYLHKYIRHVHIKDADSQNYICLMGEGVVPVGDVVRVLQANGYEGFLSFEWEKMWKPALAEPEVAFPRYISFMKSGM